jgi:ATP-binding cassette subfamily F protein 3
MEADATPAQATRVLRGLGFSSDMIAGRYDALSGGWRTRCRLAVALLVQVDLLMLDEPSNFCVGLRCSYVTLRRSSTGISTHCPC